MDTLDSMPIINGVKITPLKQIIDERGGVFHVMRASSSIFDKFGEVYFSKVNYKYIKAWKKHTEMTQNFCVPYGFLKLVIFDNREDSKTCGLFNEFFLDPENNYNLISIPNGLWYGFQCIMPDYCLLLNVADIEHNPKESITLDLNNQIIKYDWKI